ncbi:MAG: sensor domain-containing diguanylate cyclase [Sarcina sp.]
MENYEVLYKELNKEFQSYQMFVEEKLQKINQVNKELERTLSIFVNIVEVSKYINSNISDSNLLSMINDMIVGMLGVNYSTIHLFEDDMLVPKTTNLGELGKTKRHYVLDEVRTGESFIRNDSNGIFSEVDSNIRVNSLIGVPINIKDKLIGYIIVEHMYYSFFEKEDVNFVKYIAHQVAIAIENSMLYKKIQEAAQRDSLLDICNRKYFYELIENEKKKSGNLKNFAIVMSDIDDFKHINDTFGHQFGDKVLKAVVSIMKEDLRTNDIIARYGGEEIIIFLSGDRSKDQTVEEIEKMREKIAKNDIAYNEKLDCNVTVSFGIGFSFDDENCCLSIDRIIKQADDKLYVAKRTGKNKVEY